MSADARILIVDPDTDVGSTLGPRLSSDGIECVQVGTIPEALAVLDQQAVGAIVTELVLPEGSGLDLMKFLAERRRDIPVVFLTAHGGLEWAKTAIRGGAFEYYDKPLDPETLCATLRKALHATLYAGPERRQALVLEAEKIDPTARDELTGLVSHHYILEKLPGMYQECYRQGKPLTLCLIDIEGFREFNVRQGLSAGDMLLIEVGRRLRQIVRTKDMVGRYGNDEFLLLLPGADGKSTIGLSQRILKNIMGAKWPTVDESLKLRLCIGIVEVNREESSDSLEFLDRAIEAVYHAKFQGPNSIVVWRPSLTRESSLDIDLGPSGETGPDYESIHIMMWRFREMNQRLANVGSESLRLLVAAVEARDPYTKHHSVRVAGFARHMAEELGLPASQTRVIHSAGLLHDIGKIGVPDAILIKPQKLTAAETELIRQHPLIGVNILEQTRFFTAEVPLVKHHHEWFNGTGYPDRLAGDRIPLGARIIQVADAIEAMLARRSYKDPYGVDHTLNQILKGAGEQFDPDLVHLALRLVKEGILDRIWARPVADPEQVLVPSDN